MASLTAFAPNRYGIYHKGRRHFLCGESGATFNRQKVLFNSAPVSMNYSVLPFVSKSTSKSRVISHLTLHLRKKALQINSYDIKNLSFSF